MKLLTFTTVFLAQLAIAFGSDNNNVMLHVTCFVAMRRVKDCLMLTLTKKFFIMPEFVRNCGVCTI